MKHIKLFEHKIDDNEIHRCVARIINRDVGRTKFTDDEYDNTYQAILIRIKNLIQND